MASVILKSLKLKKILNGRLFFSSAKPYYFNAGHIIRPYKHTAHGKACYSIAAYKQMANEDSMVKNHAATLNSNPDINSIDEVLSRLDSLIRRNGRTQMKNILNAFSMISSKDVTTSTHGLYLLRSCKYCYEQPSSKRTELVNQIWNRYQELGIEFDVRHYNSILDAYISNGFNFDPAKILASMEEANIAPNKVTYMLLMKKYCKDGNINGASSILEDMKEKDLSANEDVFNYLIEGHVKNNDISGAKDMIEVMRSSNLKPSSDTYTILACGYAASGNKDEMMSCLKGNEKSITVENYLRVIDALASSGNHQHVDDVLSLIDHKDTYQQEFCNAAVEMIHRGLVDTAYKLIIASYNPQYNEGTNIFVKQLIKTEKPISEVIHFCTEIFKGGLNDNIFFVATKTSVQHGKFQFIVPIYKKLMELGHSVKSTNFWPLMKYLAEEKSSEGIWLLLKKMSELGIPADLHTYLDAILPAMEILRPDVFIKNVEKSDQNKETAANALFMHYCNIGKIDYAGYITQIVPVKVNKSIDFGNFLNLSNNLNKDSIEKYLKVLKYMFEDNYVVQNPDIRGKFLAELIMRKERLLEALLEKHVDLVFSQKTLSVCDQILRSKNPHKLSVVRELRSINVEREMMFKSDLSIEEEKNLLQHLLAQNSPVNPFLVRRINHHIKTKNVDRVSELRSLFDERNLTYMPLMLTNLTSLYCKAGDVDKATETASKLKTDYPNFKPDVSKGLEYATLLVNCQKFDESSEALKHFLTQPYIYTSKENVVRSIRKVCHALCDSTNVEFVKNMQNLLHPLAAESGAKSEIFEPVILFHLKRNDFTSAFEELKDCIKNCYRPGCLSLFLKQCIYKREQNILQNAIDLTSSCVGESYAILELAVALIETRNNQKASAVIEKLNQRLDFKVLEDICTQLRSQNKLYELEQLICITRPLNHANREKLYCIAIKTCADRKNFDKAKEMFYKLKEEVGELDPKTVEFFQELLKGNNYPLHLNVSTSPDINPLSIEATQTFIKHLEAGDAEAALKELNELKKGYVRSLSVKTLSDLVDLCLQNNCVRDLSCNVHAMSYIIDNAKDVLKPVLEKYSSTGDVEKFISISSFMPDFSLMSANFNRHFYKAFFSSGKHEELLSHLEQHVDKKVKVFSAYAFLELLNFSEFEDRIFDLAVKYFDLDFPVPMGILWAYYFAKENDEMANKIRLNFSFPADKVDNFIIKTIKENENVTLAQKYVDVVKSLNVRSRVKERAYGAAIDVLVLKGMYEEAVALVIESEKLNLQLHKYYLSTLMTLKSVLEKMNRPIPFSLPSNVSSGSSRDSE